MSYANQHDIGAYITSAFGGQDSTLGEEVNGVWVPKEYFLSGKVSVWYDADLEAEETLTFNTVRVEDADDSSGTGAETYDRGSTTEISDYTADNASGVVELNLRLDGARDYVRVVWEAETSDTGTANIGAVWTFAGDYNRPPGEYQASTVTTSA